MMDGPLVWLTVLAALGCGLIAGAFFAFSSFVMPALGRLPAAQGIAAMQSINVLAVTPAFMIALFGTALTCLALVVAAARAWGEPGAAWLLAGGLVYLVGVVVVTIACNVPRNNALAAADPAGTAGAAAWARYLSEWTAWNTVRAVASLAALLAFVLALAGSQPSS